MDTLLLKETFGNYTINLWTNHDNVVLLMSMQTTQSHIFPPQWKTLVNSQSLLSCLYVKTTLRPTCEILLAPPFAYSSSHPGFLFPSPSQLFSELQEHYETLFIRTAVMPLLGSAINTQCVYGILFATYISTYCTWQFSHKIL